MQEETDITESLENDHHWDEERRLLNIHNTIPTEPMEFIHAKFLYLNNHDYIENIICENIPLSVQSNGSILKKEKVIQLIQQKKIKTKDSKYKFIDLILCNFSVPSNSIYSFSKSTDISESAQKHVKKVSAIEDLFIKPSIFPFHQINSLYFFFEECEIEKNNNTILKSILKTPQSNGPPKLTKKKVRISLAHKNDNGFQKKPKQTKKKKLT